MSGRVRDGEDDQQSSWYLAMSVPVYGSRMASRAPAPSFRSPLLYCRKGAKIRTGAHERRMNSERLVTVFKKTSRLIDHKLGENDE
jgi:hypothetical protein